jgi:CheY-like chemotaxis protein
MPYGKVLVVDDLQTNLDVMTGLLMPYGLTVDTVLSGREAVEAIRNEEVRYDLVFMDHMMPEMDGLEAARIIRTQIGSAYARELVMVALTANAVAGNREMFLNSGFTDYISKPIDIKQLDMVLNRWIRDKQSEATLQDAEKRNLERVESGGGFNEGRLDAEWEAGRRAEPEKALLVRLSAAVAEFNADAAEEILVELERYRYDEGEELVEWLREQADNFNYEAMYKSLEDFLGHS